MKPDDDLLPEVLDATFIAEARTLAALRLCLILVDARRDLEAEEAQLVEWLASLDMPHRIVVTKVDKLSAGDRAAATARFRAALARPLFASGHTGQGVGQLWRVIRA